MARIFSGLVGVLGTALLVAGVVMACQAALRWLQVGHGEAMLVKEVLVPRLPDPVRGWLAHPLSWQGLHRLVEWALEVPLFAVMTACGFLLLLANAAPRRP
jgi:hypothetical protein